MEGFKNATYNQWSFWINFAFAKKKETPAGKSQDYLEVIVFKSIQFQTDFRPRKRNVGVFKFLRFERRS